MMRILLPLALIGALASTQGASAQQDPGKQVVGRIKVEVYHATDGDPGLAGKHAVEVGKDLTERLQTLSGLTEQRNGKTSERSAVAPRE